MNLKLRLSNIVSETAARSSAHAIEKDKKKAIKASASVKAASPSLSPAQKRQKRQEHEHASSVLPPPLHERELRRNAIRAWQAETISAYGHLFVNGRIPALSQKDYGMFTNLVRSVPDAPVFIRWVFAHYMSYNCLYPRQFPPGIPQLAIVLKQRPTFLQDLSEDKPPIQRQREINQQAEIVRSASPVDALRNREFSQHLDLGDF